ncbi:MAG: hypothetical protein IT269_00800 [Saprospiraceae bacterium]|nr:hypothetical protein [Saprospiraceae bacterium]
MRIFFFLLAFLLHNYFTTAQNVSVFSRIEAQVLGLEIFDGNSDADYYDYDPAWLAAHPPHRMDYLEVDSTGPVTPVIFTLAFERFSDCRLKSVRVSAPGTPVVYEINMEYDLLNRKVTMTTIDYEDIPTGEYYWRFSYYYDASENITKIERYFFEATPNDFVLDRTWTFSPFNTCQHYMGYTDVEGTFNNNIYNVARAYLTGTCRQAMAVISKTNGTPQQRSVAWTYDGDGHIKTIKNTDSNNFCNGAMFEYDAQGNRIRAYDINCAGTDQQLQMAFGWNNNQSLAYMDFSPASNSTWERFAISYAPCGTVSAAQPTTSASEIRCISPVNAGQAVSVFNLPEDIACQWKLIDLQSKTVLEGKWAANESAFNLPANLPGGLYTLVVSSEDHNLMTTLRLVVNAR